MGIRTHYDNLQITKGASASVIRAAYKALSQQHHPDKNPDNVELAHHRMKLINAAYKILSDPISREQHDRWIKESEDAADNDAEAERAAEVAAAAAAAEKRSKMLREREHEAARKNEELRRQRAQQKDSQNMTAAANRTIDVEFRATSFPKKFLRLRYWFMLIGAIFVRLVWPDQTAVPKTLVNSPAPAPTQTSLSPTTPTETAAEKATRLNQIYANEVRVLESRYSWLNPDTPGFRRDLVQEALQSKELYEGQGIAPHIAIRRAVADVASVRQGWNLKLKVVGKRWKLVSWDHTEKTFIDMRSVNGDLSERVFLLKRFYSVAEKVFDTAGGVPPLYFVTATERYYMRCGERSAAQGYTRYYSLSGLEIIDPERWARNARRDMNKTFIPIAPDDLIIDAAFDIVCAPFIKTDGSIF